MGDLMGELDETGLKESENVLVYKFCIVRGKNASLIVMGQKPERDPDRR